jgi:hypothetical protein
MNHRRMASGGTDPATQVAPQWSFAPCVACASARGVPVAMEVRVARDSRDGGRTVPLEDH